MSDFLPPEVIHSILVSLPVKSLITCSAVCKSWRSLIRNTAFINHHLHLHLHNSNAQSDLLLINSSSHRHEDVYWLHNTSNGESTSLINPSLLFDPLKCFRRFWVSGTCNGLICISAFRNREAQTRIEDLEMTIIWNPSIRKYITLPRPINSLSRTYDNMVKYAIVSDLRANDYKVLRIMFVKYRINRIGNDDLEVKVEVYSLAQGCWKSLTASANIPRGYFWLDEVVYLNGALHWFRFGHEHRDNVIISFDMFNEQFSEMLVPQALARSSNVSICISRYGESLACVASHISDVNNVVIHIWVMTNYGVIESWTEMFTVHLTFVSIRHLDGNGDGIQIRVMTEGNVMESRIELYLGGFPQYFLNSKGITRNEEILFSTTSRGLLSVDLKNGQAKTIGWERVGVQHHYFVDSFVESLVLLDEANAVSY